MIGLLRVLVLIVVAQLTWPSSATIFGRDGRYAVPQESAIREAVGTAHYRLRAATAFMVGPCHAVTSQHLISQHKNPLGARVTLRVPHRGSPSLKGTVVKAGHMERRASPTDFSSDWILLRLDQCRSARLPYFELAATSIDSGVLARWKSQGVASAGFPSDLNGLVIEPSCRLHAFTSIGWLHDCALYYGASGSPIFIETSGAQNRPLAVALQAAGVQSVKPQSFRLDSANIAVPVWPIAQALRLEQQ